MISVDKYIANQANPGKTRLQTKRDQKSASDMIDEGNRIYNIGVAEKVLYHRRRGSFLRVAGILKMNPYSGSNVEATQARRERFDKLY